MVQALLIIAGDTGRCDKDAINTSSAEGFDDRHFLVRVVVGGAEEDTEASLTSHFFDAFHNVTPERIGNGGHHQTDGAGLPVLQTLCNRIGRIAHLTCHTLDALSYIDTNQWAITESAGGYRMQD